jgi:hypothetical protein
MKAFRGPLHRAKVPGLILLLAEKWSQTGDFSPSDPDEHNRTDILTSGLTWLPPSRQFQWPWEFVVRYSGATVPDFHGVP